MNISLEQLEEIADLSTDKLRLIYLPHINTTLKKYSINSVCCVSSFLSQILHESMYFKYTEEIASGKAYEYRKDLGNLEPEALAIAHKHGSTTGKFYKGFGLLQITGYYNFVKVSKALEIDCVNSPKLLKEPLYATLSAGWFFDAHNCKPFAEVDNNKAVTKIINGGYNGLDERMRIYNKAKSILTRTNNENRISNS